MNRLMNLVNRCTKCQPFGDYKLIDSAKEFNGIEQGRSDWLCPSEE
jgi:hypothetical protein